MQYSVEYPDGQDLFKLYYDKGQVKLTQHSFHMNSNCCWSLIQWGKKRMSL